MNDEQRKMLGAKGFYNNLMANKNTGKLSWFPTEEQKKENWDRFLSDWQKDVAQQKEIQDQQQKEKQDKFWESINDYDLLKYYMRKQNE